MSPSVEPLYNKLNLQPGNFSTILLTTKSISPCSLIIFFIIPFGNLSPCSCSSEPNEGFTSKLFASIL